MGFNPLGFVKDAVITATDVLTFGQTYAARKGLEALLAGAPKPPTLTPPPDIDPIDLAIRRAQQEIRRRMFGGVSGLAATFLTGPRGVAGPAPTTPVTGGGR